MDAKLRDDFDRQVEVVMAALPRQVHALLDEVPLFIEDYPSVETMRQLGVRHAADLQGLYTGVPLGDRSVMHSGLLPDVVQIFREGILSLATDRQGRIDEEELRRQIRITILHELGHHHGMTEEELEALGY